MMGIGKASAGLVDLHTHLMGHRDRPVLERYVREFLDRAQSVGLREIGFSDHDYYESEFDFDVIRRTAREYPNLNVRIGVEFDYMPGREEQIAAILGRHDLDYAIGSVHELDSWAFDVWDQKEDHKGRSHDDMYRGYFSLVRQAALSGLFQIIGHLDLIKVYGIRPDSEVLALAEDALETIADGGLCVEINTNGLNKPVKEFYPETVLIQALAVRGAAFTLGSDAHEAERTGENLHQAADILRGLGVRRICSFAQKKPVVYEL